MLKSAKKIALFSLGLLSSISLAVHAGTTEEQHVIVAPQCLIKNVNASYKTLSSTATLGLIQTDSAGIDAFIEAKHIKTATPCGGFMDVTESWNAYHPKNITAGSRAKSFLNQYDKPQKKSLTQTSTNYAIQYPDQVNQLISQINAQEMWTDLTAFSDTSKTQFPDRYANSDTGVKAAEWLKNKIETLARDNNRSDISVYTVATGTRYKQPSVVVKIGESTAPGIVIGGHMDTLSSSWELKPGADDDGSGSMTVMGVARTLISSGMHFKKPIYIIWYSAEEMGLVGSGYVVKDFKQKNIPVEAVLQFDMTGYAYKNDPTMWLITDNINTNLTNYLETLIKTYVKKPVGRTRCGYACSDHASWSQAGFTAAFPFESSFGNDDPYIHTAQDTMDVLSLSHITDFAKLGVAFAVELAEPVA
ncbi:Bacterial leucyl aminopeptidase [Aquicella siphonis]|uniref:Bacterial leucyl aminopeptidase n=1 Tax=Aquicella siphonis TaxID=254247 RepID=A0A5E4PK49_9COXI|nr:M20/M25/M40 family metallo-hydrolase [Aquicella siphonis]VVC76743.1 Bacterial leucyl aminopeptidase [Aquicella siphonis]